MRSKGALAILVLLILVGLGGCYSWASYNRVVSSDEAVANAWADVENQYQRRADLVPNLIDVVESAASIDKKLIEAVEESNEAVERLGAADPSDQEALRRFAALQQRLSSGLATLTKAVQSNQSVEAHRDLLVQLEGTENRIAVARRKYNEIVADYNRTVRRFPKNVIAGLFGFEPRPAFTAEVK